MKKLVFLLSFIFICSLAYGEISWRDISKDNAVEMVIDEIKKLDPVFEKVLQDQEIKNEFAKILEADRGDIVGASFLDGIIGAILEVEPNMFAEAIGASSTLEETNSLINSEVEKILPVVASKLGEDFDRATLARGIDFDKTFDKFFGPLPDDAWKSIKDLAMIMVKGYQKGIITLVELESVWEKIKGVVLMFVPNFDKFFWLYMKKFEPVKYREYLDLKLEDFLTVNSNEL